MKSYAICPCCSNKLMHHISNHRDYWFCRRCWPEMPAIKMTIIKDEVDLYRDRQANTASLSNLIKPDRIKFKTS